MLKIKFIGLFIVVLFCILIAKLHDSCYTYFDLKTLECSIQTKDTCEYWGIYWTDGRPYIYHNGQYYILYYENFDNKTHSEYMTWKFNDLALKK